MEKQFKVGDSVTFTKKYLRSCRVPAHEIESASKLALTVTKIKEEHGKTVVTMKTVYGTRVVAFAHHLNPSDEA